MTTDINISKDSKHVAIVAKGEYAQFDTMEKDIFQKALDLAKKKNIFKIF